jgi:hypothetical protein
VGYFFIGKQKVVLFPKHRENGWEYAVSALTSRYIGVMPTYVFSPMYIGIVDL